MYPKCCSKSACWGQNFWKIWLDLGAGSKVVQILRESYTLPFRFRPNLTRSPSVVSCYVNPLRNSYLFEALHQLIDKNAVELVHSQTFNRLFLVPKPNNRWRPILDLSKNGEIQNGDTGNHQDIPPARGVGYFHRLQGRLLPYTNTRTIQEISESPCLGSDILVQALPFGLSTAPLEFTVVAKEVKLMTIQRGIRIHQYLDDWLVRARSRQVCLQHTQDLMKICQELGWLVNLEKIGTGAQANLRFCRLPVRPQGRPGPTYTGPLAEPSGQNPGINVTTDLSGPATHVHDRFTNSHREASSPRPTSYETHTVASQEQLACTRVAEKGDPNSQVHTPPFKMVVRGRQCSHRPAFTPNKICSANLYRRIKRRVGRSLKQAHCKGLLVSTRKQAAHKLSGAKSSLFSSKGVPRPLHRPDSLGVNRQHHSGVLHKQGGRHEVGPTLCPIVENPDLVFQEAGDSQSPTHPRSPKHGS